MFILIIAAIVIAFVRAPVPFDPARIGVFWCIFGTCALSVLVPLLGFIINLFPLRRYDPASRLRVSIMQASLIFYRLLMLGSFAFVIFWLNWLGFVVYSLNLADAVLLDEFLILLPFLVSLCISLIPLYYLERSIRHFRWTLVEYFIFQLRHNILIILVPWFFYVAVLDATAYIPASFRPFIDRPVVYVPLVAFVIILVYIFSPLVIRILFDTRTLEPGPLRARLESFCKRMNFRCRDIRVWVTSGGAIVNACVLGTVSRFRYVFITDALIERLTPEEVEAVFGHEVGHSKGRHIPFYLFFCFCFFFVMSASEIAAGWIGKYLFSAPEAVPVWFEVTVFTVAVIFYWGFLFGYISRRFERQADIFGALSGPGVYIFIGALEKIAYYNGLGRTRRSWRHFSIEKRVRYLTRLAENPDLIKGFVREIAVAIALFMIFATARFLITLIPHLLQHLTPA